MISVMTVVTALAVQAGPPSCDDSALHRQFDFWAGDWAVYTPDGQFAGTNSIEPGAGGCVLHEHWTNANGGTGHSLNWVDNATGDWRQLWVGRRYQIDYAGGLNAQGAMVLTGLITYARPDGPTALDFRGAWIPQDNGHVIQFFEQYDAEADSWNTWGLLTYVPVNDTADLDRAAPGPSLQTVPSPFGTE